MIDIHNLVQMRYALDRIVIAAATEVAELGITANVINPGATEVPYNGDDDDCDPLTADDDVDGDGYPNRVDCNDNEADINPGLVETNRQLAHCGSCKLAIWDGESYRPNITR